MEDIELVIKIPKESYNHLKNGGNVGASLLIENAIKNGTPLPKGHGRRFEEGGRKMLIEINPDTYINPECIEAVQKQIIYLREHSEKIVNTVIYTRGGGRFYYDGTLEECLKKLEVKETKLQEVTPDGATTMTRNTKRKGTPIEGNNESYNCENWIP